MWCDGEVLYMVKCGGDGGGVVVVEVVRGRIQWSDVLCTSRCGYSINRM